LLDFIQHLRSRSEGVHHREGEAYHAVVEDQGAGVEGVVGAFSEVC
jgi:hypothetical protein